MTRELDEIIRANCGPLEPVTTGVMPVIDRLDVRAVMFDIYGTLLISASGDITTGHVAEKGKAFTEAFAACCVGLVSHGDIGPKILTEQIAADHARARKSGIKFPEVDIIEMWRRTVASLIETNRITDPSKTVAEPGGPAGISEQLLNRLALHYELRVNPVWTMPHARQCLEALQAAGLTLGIISNAQSLTADLWRVLLDAESSDFAFNDRLMFYSYQFGRAKPGLHLFETAAAALNQQGIDPHEVLFIGNDMLNDIKPAGHVGFRTALFAGDARSLRWRKGDSRVAGVAPDVTITDLLQLIECVGRQPT